MLCIELHQKRKLPQRKITVLITCLRLFSLSLWYKCTVNKSSLLISRNLLRHSTGTVILEFVAERPRYASSVSVTPLAQNKYLTLPQPGHYTWLWGRNARSSRWRLCMGPVCSGSPRTASFTTVGPLRRGRPHVTGGNCIHPASCGSGLVRGHVEAKNPHSHMCKNIL